MPAWAQMGKPKRIGGTSWIHHCIILLQMYWVSPLSRSCSTSFFAALQTTVLPADKVPNAAVLCAWINSCHSSPSHISTLVNTRRTRIQVQHSSTRQVPLFTVLLGRRYNRRFVRSTRQVKGWEWTYHTCI